MDFKELIFVSGKGGTGKTSIALRLSKLLSEKGRRVLFVELNNHSSARSLLDFNQTPQYGPTPSGLGFDWSVVRALDCLSEYAGHLFKFKNVTDYLFNHPFIRKMLGVTPGLNDLALLGKLTSGVRQEGPPLKYDHLVVDTFSTGSFTSFLAAPEALGMSMGVSFLRRQSFSIKEILRNKQKVQYFFVSLFEEESVDELEEVLRQMEKTFKDQTSVIMNKYLRLEKPVLPDPDWQGFIKKKLAVQKNQIARVLNSCKNIYFVDRHVLSLKDEIKTRQGGFLRTPLNR